MEFPSSLTVSPAIPEFKISSGGKDVFRSGSVISFGGAEITFQIYDLKVKIEFESGEGEPTMRGSSGGKELTITLVNFSNPLGTGTKVPIEVGTVMNRKLWLAFSVYPVGQSVSRLFNFSFFIG